MVTPPILTRPKRGINLFLYLSVTTNISSILVQDGDKGKNILLCQEGLEEAEICFQKIEFLTLAVIVTARKLRACSQGSRSS